jgi:hypothetical protein
MCPLCITTAALTAAGATSGAGVVVVAAAKWRRVRGWFSRGRAALRDCMIREG